MSNELHGWAETTVYPMGEGGKDSPEHGDTCPVCKSPLVEGERVFRVTEPALEQEWVHEKHIAREDGR